MHFKQLVNEVTHPVSGTCLDHIYSNYPERIGTVICHNIGLADHLPVFAVRKYARESCHYSTCKNNSDIIYRVMKHFKEEQFKNTCGTQYLSSTILMI